MKPPPRPRPHHCHTQGRPALQGVRKEPPKSKTQHSKAKQSYKCFELNALEDDLKIFKWKYLSNHRPDHIQFLNLSLYEQTKA